jgi:hypothetical protein
LSTNVSSKRRADADAIPALPTAKCAIWCVRRGKIALSAIKIKEKFGGIVVY